MLTEMNPKSNGGGHKLGEIIKVQNLDYSTHNLYEIDNSHNYNKWLTLTEDCLLFGSIQVSYNALCTYISVFVEFYYPDSDSGTKLAKGGWNKSSSSGTSGTCASMSCGSTSQSSRPGYGIFLPKGTRICVRDEYNKTSSTTALKTITGWLRLQKISELTLVE